MSYDVAVWYADAPMTPDQAATYLHHINRDWVVVRRAAAFDAFMAALGARVPDAAGMLPALSPDTVPSALLTTWDDMRHDAAGTPVPAAPVPPTALIPSDQPWSWIAELAPHGTTVVADIRSEEAWTAMRDLAAEHGLVFYDPQSGELDNPPGIMDPDALTVHLTMTITGRPPALAVRIALDGATIVDTVMPSRADAHAGARVIALAHDLPFYAVDDPATLAQSFGALPPGMGDPPPGQNAVFDHLKSLQTGSDGPVVRRLGQLPERPEE